MAKVIVFGVQDFASLAHFYLKSDSPHDVCAFCVHREYLPQSDTFEGIPLVAFEEVAEKFSPSDFKFFAPMSPKNMNRLRANIYAEAKAKGYSFINYISSRATTFYDLHIGDNCFILEDNTIQPFVKIGNNVTLWSGNHIGHHSVIGDHVTFTSHVVLSGHCNVGPYSFFGVNSTIRDGLTIAEGSFIAMSAAVTSNTEEWGVYKGNPAEKSKISSTQIKF